MTIAGRGYAKQIDETHFKRATRQAEERSAAWTEYEGRAASVVSNTERLKGLRLERDQRVRDEIALITPAPVRTRKKAVSPASAVVIPGKSGA